ncbi:MAG TPA: formate dehydrogenase accessory sulfurtransferase FdhD [Oscillospiraceae bacterium]|nr:formate dehydrogenase accessory sulfurtransferase FdhD [Oscillospiraceae bacterium]
MPENRKLHEKMGGFKINDRGNFMESTKKYDILRIDGENKNIVEDITVLEYPFTIFVDDEEIITLLCSPESLEYLAIGFLYSEGFIKNYSEIDNIGIDKKGGQAHIRLKFKKTFSGRLRWKKTITSGGGKGIEFYNTPDFLKPGKTIEPFNIYVHEIKELMEQFDKRSGLFHATGGVHACAICNKNNIIYFEEDIGRHNALDKVLGRALTDNMNFNDKMVLTSGRISSEMLMKAVKRGIAVVISRSAPTSLAVQMARELNIVLAGFVRGEKMNIYSNFSSLKF